MAYQLPLCIVIRHLPRDQKNTPHRLQRVRYQLASDEWRFKFAMLASDPAQNPYWKRDVRRAYPQLSVITQHELSNLLIEHSGVQAYVHTYYIMSEGLIGF